MGRRPNPLVVEFFERGAKLEDKTNRYEHRCKKCGELFPKGRSDALTSHLLRKCPNVTKEDRDWVCDQLQQTPDRSGVRSNPPSILSNSITQDTILADISLQNLQQQSALDTLAEVSRHHLDYTSQRGFSEIFQDPRHVEPINEQAIIAQLREGGVDIPVTNSSEHLYLYTNESGLPQPEDNPPSVPLISTAAEFTASPLVQTASAANQQLEQACAQGLDLTQTGPFVDPQLHNMGAALRSDVNGVAKPDQHPDSMAWDPTNLGQPTFGTLTMHPNGNTAAFMMLPKGTKQKTRAHFNDTRRKEVQDIRKKGACLRCRMLKKPCSGETPCSTCRSVESARLWKGKCLRTRVADEFDLWSTSLFYARAKIAVPAAVRGMEQQTLPGSAEIRFFSGSDTCLSFAVKAFSDPADAVDPDLHDRPSENADSAQRIWLLDEGDTMAEKLESYVTSMTEALINNEPSDFMKSTLQRALAVIRAEDMDQNTKMETSDQKSPRSCYSLQNQLLKNVVELLVHTKILASPTTYALQIRYNPTSPPQHLAGESDWASRPADDIPSSSQSYQLIRSQLMATIESRCSKLSKTIMNELERRLLQRQQVSRFATYLSAVVLLNAVELMTGLYRPFGSDIHLTGAFSPPPGKENVATTEPNDKASNSTAVWGDMSHPPFEYPYLWPLDTPPSSLWPQGPQFADLLTMLLRMRALPPKTCQTSDGTLAALKDYSLPVHVNGRPVREQIDEQTKTAAEWLDPLKLKVADLVLKRDGPLPGRDASADEWEMRFVAKVLLPDRIR